MNLNFDFNGKTTLAKWWKIVKENFQKIATAFNAEVKAREDAISTEKSEREAADSNLSSRLSAVEQVSGGTGGGSSLNNYDYKYDSEDPSVIYINTVTDLPYGIYTFIPEREVTALYTRVGDNVQSWDCEGNVFTPGNQYVLQTNSDSINLDVIGVIPLEQNLINVKLSEIQDDLTPQFFNTEVFAEVGKVLVIQNDLENETLKTLNIDDELWYTLSQPLEVGKIYITITKSLPEDYGIDGKVHGAIDVYTWNGPESGGGSSITVDSKLSDTSENPVQNKVVKEALETTKTNMDSVVMGIESRLLAELDKKYEIPNGNADTLLQYVGTDSSGNGLQLNYDFFVPYFSAGNDGGYVFLENVAGLEFNSSNGLNGFKNIDEITQALNGKQDWECNYAGFNNMDEALQAIVDLQDRVSALEG